MNSHAVGLPELDHSIEIEYVSDVANLVRQSVEIDNFINDAGVTSSVYHLSGYLISRIQNQHHNFEWHVAIARKENKIICIIPLFIRKTPIPVKLGLLTLYRFDTRLLRFFGDQISFISNIDSNERAALLKKVLNSPALTYDLGRISALAVDDSTFSIFNKIRTDSLVLAAESAPEVVHTINFPDSWDGYLGSMTKKRRYNLKASVKQLLKNFDSQVALRKYQSEEDIAQFLAILDGLYNRTWQAKTFGVKNRQAPEEQNIETALARAGCACSYALFVQDKPVAFVRGYLHKGFYYFEEIGYEPAWSDHSVGTVLNLMLLEDLMTSPDKVSQLSFGYGDNVYKRVFGTHQYPATNSFLYRRGSKAAAIVYLNQTAARIYKDVRQLTINLKIDRLVRRFLKHT